ncbi:MAG: EAL domain-containing protein [Oscillospiraceae bacterium]|nr:EAL domain-containing protein [Oscillospiraceae bacterium]
MDASSGAAKRAGGRRPFIFPEIIDAVNRFHIFVAIRRGLALMIPLMIIGSVAVFINNLPVDAYQNFMKAVFGEGWKKFGSFVEQASFGIASLGANLAVGYTLTERKRKDSFETHPMMGAFVSLACLFALTQLDGLAETFLDFLTARGAEIAPETVLAFSTKGMLSGWLGTDGMFIALISAILGTELYLFLCRFKRLRIRWFSNAADLHLSAAITTLIPFFLTVSCFGVIRVLFGMAGYPDVHSAMYEALSNLFRASSSQLSTGLSLQAMIHGLWFFGVHGNKAFAPVVSSVVAPALQVNIDLAARGLPPTQIITSPFFNAFVYLGGSGAVMCLILALFIGARRSNTRRVATIGIFSSLINVNEIMIFGTPVVLNLYLLMPVILAPIGLTLTTYAAMALKIVPLTVKSVTWTTPIFLSGYQATGGSVAGVILQLFNLAAGTAIYLPFVRLYDRSLNRDNRRAISGLMDTVLNINELRRTVLLDRADAEGNMARALAADLRTVTRTGELALHYQPLVNDAGDVFCVEALLRWNHPLLGQIPPPVAVAVAEESGLTDELGFWVFETAVKALKGFRDGGLDIGMSVNVTPSQLDNISLAPEMTAIVARHGVKPEMIDIEITEQMALGGFKRMQVIHELRDAGFHVAIDDFGMGHGSLTYLKDLNLDVIKIDGALVREIETNLSCRDIISTITNLGGSLNIMIIAEYVENDRQRELLLGLGCTHYQGYLYSPALPFDQAAEYIKAIKAGKEPVPSGPQ